MKIGDTVFHHLMGLGIVKDLSLSCDPQSRFLMIDFPYMDRVTIHDSQVYRVDMDAYASVAMQA